MESAPALTSTSRYAPYARAEPVGGSGWNCEQVVPTSPHFAANGIRVHDGRLFVAQSIGDTVTSVDLSTGAMAPATKIGSAIVGPDDVAFDADGTMYTTLLFPGMVGRTTVAGVSDTVLDDCPAANGITVTPEGRLFVAEMRMPGRLVEIDGRGGNNYRVVRDDLDMMNGMEEGPDGRLYVPRMFAHEVIAVHPDSGEVEVIATDIELPTAVKFDGAGRMAVADSLAGEVVSVDLESRERVTIGKTVLGIDNIAFDPEGNVYASSYVDGRVERFRPGRPHDSETIVGPSLVGPHGLCRLPDGRLVAADATSLVFVGDGGELIQFSTTLLAGTLADLSGYPFVVGVAPAGATQVYMLWQSGDVYLVDLETSASTHVVKAPETPGGGQGYSAAPSDPYISGAVCAIANGARIVVAVRGTGVVVELDGGAVVGEVAATGMPNITAVAATSEAIAVTDGTTGALVVIGEDDPRDLGTFSSPAALAMDDENVFVIDSGTRQVIRVDRRSGTRDILASDLGVGFPAEWTPFLRRSPSLLLDEDGSLTVGCDGDGSIWRLSRR
jgi:sugar lactone lactonase YvrE